MKEQEEPLRGWWQVSAAIQHQPVSLRGGAERKSLGLGVRGPCSQHTLHLPHCG